MKQKRWVEVYVVHSFGGDSGDWWATYQLVDYDLPREEAVQAAIDMTWADLREAGAKNIVDVQLYWFDEEPYEED